MALRIKKEVGQALAAARMGEQVDLSKIVVPRMRGGHVVKATIPSTDATRSFFLSDKTVDRDNDTIDPMGWDLGQFKINGTVLWAHDNHSLPIAKPLNTEVKGDVQNAGLYSDAQFSQSYDFAKLLLQLIDEGVLKNVSVGFIPTEWTIDEARHGINFIKQQLVEFSVVPVGSHPGAMVQLAKAKKIDMAPLYDWASKWLDGDKSVAASVADEDEIAVLHKSLECFKGSTNPGIAPLPTEIEKRAISYQAAHSGGTPKAPEGEKWDAAAEVAAATVGDLKVMCAWVDDKNAEDKGSYKLPHHKAAGHDLVWNGVRAAMGALLGARGGVNIPDGDRKGVYNHLAKHYKEFDKTPPDFKAYGQTELVELFGRDADGDTDTTPVHCKSCGMESCKGAKQGDHCQGCAGGDCPGAGMKQDSFEDPIQRALAQLEAAEESIKASGIQDERAQKLASAIAEVRAELAPKEGEPITADIVRSMVRAALNEILRPKEQASEGIAPEVAARMVREAMAQLKEEILRETGRLPT